MIDIRCGDALEVLRTLPEVSVDAVVTDPPYGLRFMGKTWDHGIPGEPFWLEALRVAKPGAHLAAFGGTRTYHRLAVAIEDAGWEIRDCLMWLYGSGFPKSLDVSKATDKALGAQRARDVVPQARSKLHGDRPWMNDPEHRFESKEAITAAAAALQGWGTALKPAWEPIILARKPLAGTVAANVQEHGTGAINVDGCRVPAASGWTARGGSDFAGDGGWGDVPRESNPLGRWPANVLLGCACGSPRLVCLESPYAGDIEANVAYARQAMADSLRRGELPIASHLLYTQPGILRDEVPGERALGIEAGLAWGGLADATVAYMDRGTSLGMEAAIKRAQSEGRAVILRWLEGDREELEHAARCAVGLLDAQSGIQEGRNIAKPVRKIQTGADRKGNTGSAYGAESRRSGSVVGLDRDDFGGASRFFYTAKASASERHYAGKNTHPTVKPVDLMRWLCRLVTPPGGLIVDPFMGSGSTGIAALAEGFRFLGCDKDPASVAIARKRISGPLFAEANA